MPNIVLGMQIALLFTGGIMGGIGLGLWIDKTVGISPWGIILGVIGGVVIAFTVLIRIVNKKQK